MVTNLNFFDEALIGNSELEEISRVVVQYRAYLAQQRLDTGEELYPEEIVIEVLEHRSGVQGTAGMERFSALARTPEGKTLTASNSYPSGDEALNHLARALRALVDPERFAEAIS